MSKLNSVSLYDIYKLEGEDKAMAMRALIEMYNAIQILGDTYVGFSDNEQNSIQLQQEMEGYIADKRKTDPEFTITISAYTFLRFGITIEDKLQELNPKFNFNEEETIG